MTADLTGTHELFVPADMFNVLAPDDVDEAKVVFADLFREMFPSINAGDLANLVDGILQWRTDLVGSGVLFHGIVALPEGYKIAGEAVGATNWQVFAGITPVPVHDEIDAGVLAAKVFADQYPGETTYTESFPSTMGWGAGMITELPLPRPDAINPNLPDDFPTTVALAGTLSGAHGSPYGLAVFGFALDVQQKHELAAVVAAIGGRSVITVGDEAPATEAGG